METVTSPVKLRSVTDRLPRLDGAQRAFKRWALVDDHQALLEVNLENDRLLNTYALEHKMRLCGLCARFDNLSDAHNPDSGAEYMFYTNEEIPWPDSTFHTLLVHPRHDTSLRKSAAEWVRVLKSRGELLIALPWLPVNTIKGGAFGLFQLRSNRALVHLLRGLGFQDVSVRMGSIGWGMLVARNLKKE